MLRLYGVDRLVAGGGSVIVNADGTVSLVGNTDITGTLDATGLITATAGVKLGTTVTLTEGAANRLDLASGDSLAVIAGNIFIGDTANANMTQGLTINQGANDNEILALKSSDVAHGMTGRAETDTFGKFAKAEATSGGMEVQGFKDADGSPGKALVLTGNLGEAADTTKSVSAIGVTHINSRITDGGTSTTAVGANGNLAVIANNNTARFIFDAEGSAHGDVEWIAFDTHNDLAVLEDFETLMAPGQVQRMFGEAITHDRAFFEREGLIHDVRTEDGSTRGMVNFSRLAMLNTGTIRQVGGQVLQVASRADAIEFCLRSIIDSNAQLTGRDEALAILAA